VLLVDEIDTLIGDTLIAVLRQLRAGYHRRPKSFPQSVVLCGVRDVRDYRIHSAADGALVTGGSAFNVKAWTAAPPPKGTSWSSTATRIPPGRTSSSGARRPPAALRSPSGACDRYPARHRRSREALPAR